MKFYLAPMEGITGYIYRQAYNSCFKPMDRYFTPFLAPKHKSGFSSKELNDILPEHNQGMEVIPQILTSDPEDFLDTAVKLKEYGYTEVNLNLGCPSGTVAAKGKGAGFLKDTESLPGSWERSVREWNGKIFIFPSRPAWVWKVKKSFRLF